MDTDSLGDRYPEIGLEGDSW